MGTQLRLGDKGFKSKRDKGTKHFKKVGYAGDDKRPIPRWACNEAIDEVKNWQDENMSAQKVFGYLDPRKVANSDVLDKMFEFNGNPNYDERGSSANWKDDSEWNTQLNPILSEQSSIQANPFQLGLGRRESGFFDRTVNG